MNTFIFINCVVKVFFKISNYKILRLGEYLSLCVAEKCNKIGVDMQTTISEKENRITGPNNSNNL